MQQLEVLPPKIAIDRGARFLANNSYPGRIAIMGLSQTDNLALQAYVLMGRSAPSKNRVFTQEGTSIRTIAPDKTPEEMAKVKCSGLIYYRAMRNERGVHVVSNGAQTDPILESILAGQRLDDAIRNAPEVEGEIDETGKQDPPTKLSHYEPDGPNYTPRITGVIDTREDAPTAFGLAIVSKEADSDEPLYSTYTSSSELLTRGVGYGIQTYRENDDPLPSFNQRPYAYPLGVGTLDTAIELWDRLNDERRVAVAVRGIDLISGNSVGTVIINGQA